MRDRYENSWLSCSNKGYTGVEGARQILGLIRADIHELDISYDLLGNEGIRLLFDGLEERRTRFAGLDGVEWGLSEIEMGHCGLTDADLEVIMAYAAKDTMLRRIVVNNNHFELRDNLESIITSLNSSHVALFALNGNNRLLSSSISYLFDNLRSPYLFCLSLAYCDLGIEAAPSIQAYLGSTRSRDLEILNLSWNRFGLLATRELVDTIDKYNFTIRDLPISNASSKEELTRSMDPEAHKAALSELVREYQRLPAIYSRNKERAIRIQKAALRCLPIARVLLNAIPISPSDSSQPTHQSSDPPLSHFKILDLPMDVLYHIVRQSSLDPTAFSNAQFARFRKDTEGHEGLSRVLQARKGTKGLKSSERLVRERAEQRLLGDWLIFGGWNRWESDIRHL